MLREQEASQRPAREHFQGEPLIFFFCASLGGFAALRFQEQFLRGAAADRAERQPREPGVGTSGWVLVNESRLESKRQDQISLVTAGAPKLALGAFRALSKPWPAQLGFTAVGPSHPPRVSQC